VATKYYTNQDKRETEEASPKRKFGQKIVTLGTFQKETKVTDQFKLSLFNFCVCVCVLFAIGQYFLLFLNLLLFFISFHFIFCSFFLSHFMVLQSFSLALTFSPHF